MLAMALALSFVFTACDTGNGGSGNGDGGGGNIATIIIKNQSGASIEVVLSDGGASGYQYVVSGLGEKTIANDAQETWPLEIMSGKRNGYVNITINGVTARGAFGSEPGKTYELTWDGSALTQPTV